MAWLTRLGITHPLWAQDKQAGVSDRCLTHAIPWLQHSGQFKRIFLAVCHVPGNAQLLKWARDGVTMARGIPAASEVVMSGVFPWGYHWQSPSAPSLDNGYWKSHWLWTTPYFPLPIILCFFYWYICFPWLWATVCFLGNFDIRVFLWSSYSPSFTSPLKVHFLCSPSHYGTE